MRALAAFPDGFTLDGQLTSARMMTAVQTEDHR